MDNSNRQQFSIISFKLAKKLLAILIFIFIFDFFLFPAPALASENNSDVRADTDMIFTQIKEPIFNNVLPINKELNVVKTGKYAITAYNSEVGQCDDSPCITANGFNLCEHGVEDTIAANFLKFGTKVKIPELFGERIFIVRDRMNARYQDRLDIWMIDKSQAIKFSLKYATIEILAVP